MSRKRTGLRNRFRQGRSTYSVLRKGRTSDTYGTWVNGVEKDPGNLVRVQRPDKPLAVAE